MARFCSATEKEGEFRNLTLEVMMKSHWSLSTLEVSMLHVNIRQMLLSKVTYTALKVFDE